MTANSNPNLLFKSKSLQAKDAISPCYGALPVDTFFSLLVNHCKQGTWKQDPVSGNKGQSRVQLRRHELGFNQRAQLLVFLGIRAESRGEESSPLSQDKN